jgi:hypothetical protein
VLAAGGAPQKVLHFGLQVIDFMGDLEEIQNFCG